MAAAVVNAFMETTGLGQILGAPAKKAKEEADNLRKEMESKQADQKRELDLIEKDKEKKSAMIAQIAKDKRSRSNASPVGLGGGGILSGGNTAIKTLLGS